MSIEEIIEELSERYFHFNEYGNRLDKTEAIPLIEREGLKDISHILQFKEYRFRPTSDKVGDVVCTYENVLNGFRYRLGLLRWINDDGGLHTADPSEDLIRTKKIMLEDWNPSRFAKMCREYLNQLRADHNKEREKKGLMLIPSYKAGAFNEWEPMRPIRTRVYSNPDNMAFAVLNKQNPSEGWNKVKATEENALKAINKAFPSDEDREAVLDAYNDMKVFLKAMAATYRLFATEQWDSIKDEDEDTIKTALDNYFYHWRQDMQLYKHYKIANAKYEKRYKNNALTSVCKAMGILEDRWRTYIRTGELPEEKKAPKPNAGYYKESLALEHNTRMRRTAGMQLSIFDDEPDPEYPEYVGMQTTEQEAKAIRAIARMAYDDGLIKDIKASIANAADIETTKDGRQLVRMFIDNCPTLPITPYTLAYAMQLSHPSGKQVAQAAKILDSLCDKKHWIMLPIQYVEIKGKGKPKKVMLERLREIHILERGFDKLHTNTQSVGMGVYTLNSIFTHEVSIRNVLMPRNFYNRLQIDGGKMPKEYYKLASLLTEQICMRRNKADKKKAIPYEIGEDSLLVQCCSSGDDLKRHKNRILKNVEDSIENLTQLGLILHHQKTADRFGKPKYVFTLNFDFKW